MILIFTPTHTNLGDHAIALAEFEFLKKNCIDYYVIRANCYLKLKKNDEAMKNLDELEELFVSLNKNINKCVELLGRSIKGENIGRKLSAIEENNKVSFNKSIYNINSDREEVKNLLSRLNDERDEYQEMIRRENQIELEHELEKEEKKEDKKEEEKE